MLFLVMGRTFLMGGRFSLVRLSRSSINNIMKQLTVFLISTFLAFTSSNAQSIDVAFFNKTDAFLKSVVQDGLIDYGAVQTNSDLPELIQIVEQADLTGLDRQTQKAFYINAYNLHVINLAANNFPIQSVQEVNGFFNSKKITVANKKSTITDFEKKDILKPFDDPRLHFVLVCGALGCPPIISDVYAPEVLDEQLDAQTRIALNNPDFIKVDDNKTQLSQIFKWYPSDFGGSKSNIISFINKYRTNNISSSSKIGYYDYDWTLNDQIYSSAVGTGPISVGNNANRYVVSSTINKGSTESKIFNNLFTQRTGTTDGFTSRSTFLTTTYSFLYGLSDRFNIGINGRYRSTRNEGPDSSPFSVIFGGGEPSSSRTGITALGPQIRWAPVKEWSNFSIQSSFVFPIGSDLTGNNESPFIDWDGPTWNTQFFNDFTIGKNFSLFTEIDFLIEGLGDEFTQTSVPFTAIFSYNATPKLILYTLGNFSPYVSSSFDNDYFYQYGVGAKYQFTSKIELELLISDFTSNGLMSNNGQASTFNLGYRINF